MSEPEPPHAPAPTTAGEKPLSAREQRRLKQRAENPERARKMHAARLEHAAELPFAPPAAELPLLNVGCSGWFYWHWRGLFYEEALPSSQWFPHYRAHFPTVELNAPFYSWPTVANVKAWLRQLGEEPFIYTVKACELITHVKRFQRTQELIRDFGYVADLLGSHMGCFLFQFPPSHHYTPARLRSIVTQLDPARRNVVEFRHASWWNERVYAAFRQAGVIFCSTSGPRLPDELITTAEEIYLRFHGPTRWYTESYSDAELDLWAERVRASGAKRVWAYFNNDRGGHAIHNAEAFARKLREAHEG